MSEAATMPRPALETHAAAARCRVAVLWIDWYPYHTARFRGIASVPELAGAVAGIEMVGGIGVHAGLRFREELPAGLPVETLMPSSSWQNAGHLKLARAVWTHLSRIKPEVLLVPGYYTLPALAAALWCRLHGCTSVLMTESTAADHGRTWWKEGLKAFGLRSLFDWAISGGKAHVNYLRQLNFPANRIAGFYDTVDNQFFSRAASSLRISGQRESGLPRDYFLYVGRLAPEKNVDGLLASWIEYRRRGGDWSLVLVGDGPSMGSLRQLAAASGYSNDVIFPGLRSSAELPAYYAFAGCFVLPSSREPWGLVVNEAMASGLPVLVSSRCGCAQDLVEDGGNGYVFDPSDRPQLTSLLRRVAMLDPLERRAMGSVSAALIARYSPSAFGLEVLRIFRSRHTATNGIKPASH